MNDLLANPAVQSGVIPFVVAILVVAILGRIGAAWAGLCIVAGFAANLYAAKIGFSFEPLTSTRKIILITLCASVAGILLDYLQPNRKAVTTIFTILGGAAVLWVIWPFLSRMELLDAVLAGAGLALFGAWIVLIFTRLPEDGLRHGTAGLSMGLGSGFTALIGASALFGQLGLSVAAASGAWLLWRVVTGAPRPGAYSFALTVAFPVALIGVGASVYAKLPWPALILLAVVPICAFLPLSDRISIWIRAAILTAVGLVPAGLAMIYVWRTAGPVPL